MTPVTGKRGKNMKFLLTFSQPSSPRWNVSQPSKCSQSKKRAGWQTRIEDYASANKTVVLYNNQIVSISVIHPYSHLSGDWLSEKGKNTIVFHVLYNQLIVLSISTAWILNIYEVY